MPQPRVYVTRRIPDEALALVRAHADTRVWEGELPVPPDVLRDEIAEADGLLCLLTDPIDADLLDRAPRLRVVSQMAVGFDNIDVAACTARGIPVGNTPGVLTETSADLAFALLMAAARRIVEADQFTRAGKWQTWSPTLLCGQDLYGGTIGIVGMGRIGAAVARRARGFDMRVLYSGPSRKPELEASLPAEYRELDDLLRESDFVSLHTPLSDRTRNLIGERELRLMKRTSVLINTARGGVLDQKALYEALVAGTIWAAGLDVFEQEPVALSEPLLSLPNVVALPHIASASYATRGLMARMAAENLLAVLRGDRAPNTVNPEVYR